jgi:uncharacterized protein (TIGR02680 family)
MSGADRWRPVRAGIINLYEYGDQTFALAGGRLLLRGHNTSGKTKALELLLPFCLDGDISPRRLDPFASSAKEMHWNLIGCGGDDQRTGYVWLEFERLADDAGPARLTVGIGLRANRSSRDVKRWYFVARDRTVGGDLQLVREDREPVSRAELQARIGEDGEIVDTQAEYRRRLNDLLFGFEDDDRYRTMLQLMLELRRPHLSKTLNPDQVADLLSAGLPAVDDALMRRLAGGLEQLDALEQALVRLRATSARLQAFHSRAYRGYLRSVIRERGERVRRAHSRVDSAAEAVRAAEASRAEAEATAARLAAEREAAEAEVVRLEGELQAIVGSTAWRGIAELEALRQRAEAQDRTAAAREEAGTEAAAAAVRLEAERIAATGAAEEARARAEAGLGELELLAERAALRSRTDALAIQLRDGSLPPGTWTDLMRDLARDWRAVLAAHAEQLDRCRRASAEAHAAREAERVAAERVAAARDRAAGAAAQVQTAREELDHALDAWLGSLVELGAGGALPDSPSPLDEAVEAARALAHEGVDPRRALAELADRSRTALGAARATALAENRAVAAERHELAERIAAIEAQRDEGPAPPSLPRSPRDGRQGAPLWRVIEFRDDVDDTERARIEAALEASGLLDAWVLPDGALLGADTLDAALTQGPPAPAPTLANVLAPSGDDVGPDLVAGLLARVALRDRPREDSGAAISRDGAYAIGPLHGRAAKRAAEHIGASARAARRARLIAELRDADERAAAREAELAAAIARLDERAAALAGELEACPSADAVAEARRAHEVADLLAGRAAAEHEQALAAASAAAEAEVAADAERRDHALAHGLDPAIGEASLRACSDAAAELAGATTGIGSSWRSAAAAVDHAEAKGQALTEARAKVAEREQLARTERAEAARLAAEHAAAEAALGESAGELRARHERVATGLREQRDARGRLADGERDALRALDALARGADDAAGAHDEARRERDVASARFAALGPVGALDLALGVDAPDDAAAGESWPRTRVLEIARGLAEVVRGASSAPGELGQDVMRRVQLLDRELADANLGAYAVRRDDDLVLVRITDEAGDRDLGDVIEALSADIAERERLLTAEERRVFGDALVQEIADHLRARIRAVHDRVAAMNAVLARSPTAAGKRVQLEWRAIEDDTGTRRATIDVLRRAARHYGEDERRQIVEFFRARVEQARIALEDEKADESMADTLTRAFDYRRWFAFSLIEESETGRERLTARRHAVGSGGEQSVLIHLPLFAAAAALYGESPAPRLVMLDEALSGIDEETRERVLAATVAFDLDLVMTSHELWGTYRSVPSLAVYQLHREQGVRGVHAVPFRWDGEVLHELEQAELPV